MALRTLTTIALTLAFALVATVTFASGESDEPAAVAAKPMVLDPTTGEMAPAPEYGGTLTYARRSWAPVFDAVVGGTRATGWLDTVVETPLIANWAVDRAEFALDTPFPPLRYMNGMLVETWEQTDDLTIILNIRQGVHWHDKEPMNGRELTAADVEFNYHRILGLGSGFTERTTHTYQMTPIQVASVTATDRYTVVIKLQEPHLQAVLSLLDDGVTFIYPPEVIREHGDMTDWKNVVGTGAYLLTDWVAESSATWVKNPNYWGFDEKFPENRLPYLDQRIALHMPEPATMLAAVRTRQIDMTDAVSYIPGVDQAQSLQRTNPEINLVTMYVRSDSSVGMNVQRKPFDDLRVRQAMQLALDLETMNATVWGGMGVTTPYGQNRLVGLYVPFAEWPEDLKSYFTYDKARAEALLDEAGYPRGADGVRFTTTHQTVSSRVPNAELQAGMWREIGVIVELLVMPGAEVVANRPIGNFDMAASENALLVPITDRFQIDHYHNTAHPKDPFYEQRWQELQKATTQAEWEAIVRELDMRAIEQFWHVWGGMSPRFVPVQPWVVGWNGELALHSHGYWAAQSRMWIDSALKQEMGF